MLATVIAHGGCGVVLDFDLSEDAAAGSGGHLATASTAATGNAAASTTGAAGGADTTSSASSAGGAGPGTGPGSGGGCTTCLDNGSCVDVADVRHCGTDGGVCEDCGTATSCAVPTCTPAGCAIEMTADGEGCPGGTCQDGVCVIARENCINGADDNRDDLIDCADPICATSTTCIAPVPAADFSGPFAVYDGPVHVACTAAFPTFAFDLYAGLDTSAFQCPTCDCDEICRIHVDEFQDETCDTPFLWFDVDGGECIGANFATNSIQRVGVRPGVTSCFPDESGGNPTLASFSRVLTVCGTPPVGGGCSDTNLCVANPPDSSGIAARICVATSGNRTCPDGYEDRLSNIFGDQQPSDPRTCTACTCSAPPTGCGGTYSVFSDSACSVCGGNAGECAQGTPSDGCTDVSALPSNSRFRYDPAAGCMPSGGDVTGGPPAGTSPWSVCCVPE